MRLWSVHPRYLDSKGLVALWREGLLAQSVLLGKTAGYRRHPQLERFKATTAPAAAIATYLSDVFRESLRRNYRFDKSRIGEGHIREPIKVTRTQLEFEWQHLVRKLELRDPLWLAKFAGTGSPEPHPMFMEVEGSLASWERP